MPLSQVPQADEFLRAPETVHHGRIFAAKLLAWETSQPQPTARLLEARPARRPAAGLCCAHS